MEASTIENEILQAIVEFFVHSHDFNGIPVSVLMEKHSLSKSKLKKPLINLIQNNKVNVNFDPLNPHIMRSGPLSPEEQVNLLEERTFVHTCVYPTTSVLRKVVKRTKYKGRPYSLRLALGEPQLEFESFDLAVLEIYRNDPRYYYTTDDISGWICIGEDTGALERDQVLFDSFGFSYDENDNRAVAVFLRYLAGLSPEHQQIWAAKALPGKYQLHPDYFGASILGEWHTGMSVFSALIEELHVINEMCQLMGRPALFRKEFSGDKKPKDFSFLLRPTLREFNSFILTLDKIISENITKEFFLNDVPFESEVTRRDGKVVVTQKGTIQILDDWVKRMYRPQDPEDLKEMIDTFKEIRKLRQQPAHATNDDVFDQAYYHQQKAIMKRTYTAVMILRLVLESHPKVRGYKVPTHLQTAKIWMQ